MNYPGRNGRCKWKVSEVNQALLSFSYFGVVNAEHAAETGLAEVDIEYSVEVELLDRNDSQLCLNGCSQKGTCITGWTDEYGSWLPPVCACVDGYAGNDCALKVSQIEMDVDYESEVKRGTSMLVSLPDLSSNLLDLNFTAEMGQFDIYAILWNEVVAADGSSFTQNGLYGKAQGLSPIPTPVHYDHHIQEYGNGSQRLALHH